MKISKKNPAVVIKQRGMLAVGFHWEGKHNQQRLTAPGQKCQLQLIFSPGAADFFLLQKQLAVLEGWLICDPRNS